jgi:predicted nucleic acid-binding protein
MLVDTDVFIWYLRGNENAYDIIMNETDLKLSVVTYIELIQDYR